MKKTAIGIILILLALFFASLSVPRMAKLYKMQKNGGETVGTVESVSTERKLSATGRMQTVTHAGVHYTVNGKDFTADIALENQTAAKIGDKITIHYDKDDPNTVFNVPVGLKQGVVLSVILFLSGAAFLVWSRYE